MKNYRVEPIEEGKYVIRADNEDGSAAEFGTFADLDKATAAMEKKRDAAGPVIATPAVTPGAQLAKPQETDTSPAGG